MKEWVAVCVFMKLPSYVCYCQVFSCLSICVFIFQVFSLYFCLGVMLCYLIRSFVMLC